MCINSNNESKIMANLQAILLNGPDIGRSGEGKS
jgi:hypothetical protein